MPLWAIKIGAGALLFGALIAGYFAWASHQQGIGEERATIKYNAKIEKQQKEAVELLAKETARVTATEKALQASKNNQEIQDAKNTKVVAGLTARLRDLTVNGRLRDPHAGRGGGGGAASGAGSSGSGNRPDDGADASGILSADLSGLLQRLTLKADQINNAYISCRADAEAVRNAR